MCSKVEWKENDQEGVKSIMMMHDIKDGRSYFKTKRDTEDKELWSGAASGTCLRQNTR